MVGPVGLHIAVVRFSLMGPAQAGPLDARGRWLWLTYSRPFDVPAGAMDRLLGRGTTASLAGSGSARSPVWFSGVGHFLVVCCALLLGRMDEARGVWQLCHRSRDLSRISRAVETDVSRAGVVMAMRARVLEEGYWWGLRRHWSLSEKRVVRPDFPLMARPRLRGGGGRLSVETVAELIWWIDSDDAIDRAIRGVCGLLDEVGPRPADELELRWSIASWRNNCGWKYTRLTALDQEGGETDDGNPRPLRKIKAGGIRTEETDEGQGGRIIQQIV